MSWLNSILFYRDTEVNQCKLPAVILPVYTYPHLIRDYDDVIMHCRSVCWSQIIIQEESMVVAIVFFKESSCYYGTITLLWTH